MFAYQLYRNITHEQDIHVTLKLSCRVHFVLIGKYQHIPSYEDYCLDLFRNLKELFKKNPDAKDKLADITDKDGNNVFHLSTNSKVSNVLL